MTRYLAALALTGCCTVPPPRPCRLAPLPELHLPVTIRPGERGCPALPAERGPETIARCLDAQGAADLADTLTKLDAWTREAWASCGER